MLREARLVVPLGSRLPCNVLRKRCATGFKAASGGVRHGSVAIAGSDLVGRTARFSELGDRTPF